MLGHNGRVSTPTLPLSSRGATRTHSLWVSNLLVDLIRAGTTPIWDSYESHLGVARNNDGPTIANILIMWYMLLGGRVEEETFWAVDKSYAVVSLFLPPEYLALRSDSLENILSSLSQRVIELIADGNHFKVLDYLMDFLVAWKGRPPLLIPMAYQWCSAISEAAELLGLDGMRTSRRRWPRDFVYQFQVEFSQVVSNYDPPRLDNPPHTRDRQQDPTSEKYFDLLAPLRVAFRLAGPVLDRVDLKHTSHHDLVFETAFSSNDDEVIADAVCAWIVSNSKPATSCARYLVKRVANDRGFSPRLRQVAIRAIEEVTTEELHTSGLEFIRLVNRLHVTTKDGLHHIIRWHHLLVDAIRLRLGEHLSPHSWHLLDELISIRVTTGPLMSADLEIMESFEEAKNWEGLEIWMAFLLHSYWEIPGSTAKIGDVAAKLISSRPSALQRFENLHVSSESVRDKLKEVYKQARAVIPSQQPPYVSIHPCSSLL